MKIIDFHENTKEVNAVLAVAEKLAGKDFKNIKTFGFFYNDKGHPGAAKGHYIEILKNGCVDLIDTKRGKYTLHHEDSPAIIVNTHNTDFWNMVFVVLHEICHSMGEKNEDFCNRYAKNKIENFLGDGFEFIVDKRR